MLNNKKITSNLEVAGSVDRVAGSVDRTVTNITWVEIRCSINSSIVVI